MVINLQNSIFGPLCFVVTSSLLADGKAKHCDSTKRIKRPIESPSFILSVEPQTNGGGPRKPLRFILRSHHEGLFVLSHDPSSTLFESHQKVSFFASEASFVIDTQFYSLAVLIML